MPSPSGRARRAPGLARAAALAAVLAACGCAQIRAPAAPSAAAKPQLSLTAVSFAALPGWPDDHPAEALPIFVAGCRQLADAAPGEPGGTTGLGGAGEAARLGGQPAQWGPACAAAEAVAAGGDAAARAFFEQYFQPYAVTDGAAAPAAHADTLYTGYFDPEAAGSRTPGGVYRTPLLGRPGDLVQVDLGEFSPDLKGRSVSGRVEDGHLVPYYDRAQIEGGVLARRRLELLWLADPVDAFVLQIQGSGRIDLPDGRVVRVNYAGQNGRPYVPIGRILAERGEIPLEQVSMQTIRAWLQEHPDQAATLMDQNPSYVFFREMAGLRPDQGPPGALGVPLWPGRSVAIDRAFIPLGAPVYIATTDPLTGAPLRRLMLAQDIGGAIRGPARVDIFFGWGRAAEERAGRMRARGGEFLLLPRPVATSGLAGPPRT
jgi:membrane-bound lytic murein transglycosylase A